MIQSVYAMRDTRVGFLTPFVDVNNSAAVRGFENAVKSGEGYFARFNSDFDLYRLGTYDSDSGVITPLATPEFVASGASVVREVSSGV